MPTNMIIFMSI